MLFLTRKTGQAVIINDEIEVNVIEISGKTVKLGFKFPPTETVLRQELYEKIKQETELAANSANTFSKDNIHFIEKNLQGLQDNVSKAITPKDQSNHTHPETALGNTQDTCDVIIANLNLPLEHSN